MKQQLAIENIVVDKRFQSRVKGLDDAHVKDLMEAYERADSEIDCPRVWNLNGLGMVLTRGFHRIEALKRLGRKRVEVEVKNGDVADALVDAAGSNSGHGLKRTNADKRRCVDMVLEAHPDWSSRRVAEEAGVSDEFVRQYREEVEKKADGQVPTVGTCENKVTGKDGKKQSRRKKKDKDAASPEPVKQSGDETPAKETKVQPQVDGWGIQLQEHAIEPFQAVPEFDALIKHLKVAQRMLSELADKQGGRFLQKRCQWYRTGKDEDGNEKGRWRMPELDNAVRNIEDTKPTYTTCPYAHNPEKQHPDDCTACRGAYWCPPLSKQIPPNLIENAQRDLGALITEAPSV
mgnify:CR=1 FL=1